MISKEDMDLLMAAEHIRDDDGRAATVGALLSEVLMLRRDPDHRDRVKTTWGSKTHAGLARIVLRILQESTELADKAEKEKVGAG